MPEEPAPPPSGKPRRYNTGSAFAGETTGGQGGEASDAELPGDTTRGKDSVVEPTTGSAASQPSQSGQSPQIIDDFEILSKLGQGGMGYVYRARQMSLNRQVALKILPSHLDQDPIFVARFVREARVAGNLQHPNLVKVYTSGVADGTHYFAMELVEGETLGQWVKRGALPPLDALRITLDVARALEHGWRTAQLIHRDVKPGNIFLSQDGQVKLGDLGLAKTMDGETSTGLTQTGKAMGTPHYISPEQARGDKDIDFRADIYSLGCTLYQMLTGQTPYSGGDALVVMGLHRDAPPPSILKVMPQLPVPLARLVAKMLKKQKRERFASYDKLIAAIESVQVQLDPALMAEMRAAAAGMGTLEGAASSAPPAAVGRLCQTPPPPAVSQKRPTALLAGLGAGLLVLGIVGYLLWPKSEPLTAAQRYAHDHARELQAKAATDAALLSLNTATKDAPFENSLGMKFVPVPIVGGPTTGQRVLFGVWDTRVQDYEAFVKETKREWSKADVEQGPLDPAVNVSWEDAQLFCQWLTAREHLAGKLPAEWSYRLPSDHEWSCAVGIGPREDPAKPPNEKSQKINDVFPWGTEFPPPGNVGNYWSEELRPLLEAGKYSWVKGELAGRSDGFATTSPVGSFPANPYGLYDMGGNVRQWCENWFDQEQKDRVMRGAAWPDNVRGDLLLSYRSHGVPGFRFSRYGFRCVVGGVSEGRAPARSQSPVPQSSGGREGARPSEATKNAPFENSLGMKFVPVPIVCGPTTGQRVLFGVWDTRVQDYEAFVKETKREWPKVDFEQGPTHPVVMVSWEDAQLFCQWLTAREHLAGKLPAEWSYRLPSDHEWSCAVGIGPREDPAKPPNEKSQKINDAFPWGTEFPPPGNAGNYWSEELRPLLDAGKYSWIKGELPGRSDGFATTSPVGTFPANTYGLYDMGGNVWQWCEDWFDKEQKDRVLRGAAWDYYDRGRLLSSLRLHYVPGHRDYNNGFRCVVGGGSAP